MSSVASRFIAGAEAGSTSKPAISTGDPQRMIHRRNVEQWAETQPLGPLRYRGKKDAGRRRHAERRRMMFRDIIGAKARAIVLFDELEPGLEKIGKRKCRCRRDDRKRRIAKPQRLLPQFHFILGRKCYSSGGELPARLRRIADMAGLCWTVLGHRGPDRHARFVARGS